MIEENKFIDEDECIGSKTPEEETKIKPVEVKVKDADVEDICLSDSEMSISSSSSDSEEGSDEDSKEDSDVDKVALQTLLPKTRTTIKTSKINNTNNTNKVNKTQKKLDDISNENNEIRCNSTGAATADIVPKMCRFFNKPSGCRNGASCKFTHVLAICKHGTLEKCQMAALTRAELHRHGIADVSYTVEPIIHDQRNLNLTSTVCSNLKKLNIQTKEIKEEEKNEEEEEVTKLETIASLVINDVVSTGKNNDEVNLEIKEQVIEEIKNETSESEEVKQIEQKDEKENEKKEKEKKEENALYLGHHCPFAHWQKCENLFCHASTIRRFCKFCWRSRRNTPILPVTDQSTATELVPPSTNRYFCRCATPGCQYLTPYLFCGACFHATSYKNTRSARQRVAYAQRQWTTMMINQLHQRGLHQHARLLEIETATMNPLSSSSSTSTSSSASSLYSTPHSRTSFQIPIDLLARRNPQSRNYSTSQETINHH